jgi:hypothetical protein
MFCESLAKIVFELKALFHNYVDASIKYPSPLKIAKALMQENRSS